MSHSKFMLLLGGALLSTALTAVVGISDAEAATFPCGTGHYIVSSGVAQNGSSCTGPLTLDSSVTTVLMFAFSHSQITSLTLDDALTTILENAFDNSPLTSVTFNNALRVIGGNAFSNTHLTSLTFGSSLISINGFAFYNVPVTSITFDKALTTIGMNAFQGSQLTCLTKLNLSDSDLVTAGITNAAALQSCGVPDNGAAQRAAALAAEQAAAAAKAMQDQALVLGTLALAIGSIESGLSTLTVAATQKQGVGTHKVSKKLKKKSKKK
jgi:hypothetical protein